MKSILVFGLLALGSVGSADVSYDNVPRVGFYKVTYSLSEPQKDAILTTCRSELKAEREKLVKAGLTILAEPTCKRYDLAPGEAGEADHVMGSLQFIR